MKPRPLWETALLQRAEEQSNSASASGNVRPPKRWQKYAKDKAIKRLHAIGAMDAQIADALEMTAQGVAKARQRLGLPRNPTSFRKRKP